MDVSNIARIYKPGELDSFFGSEVKNASWMEVFKYLLLGALILSLGSFIQAVLFGGGFSVALVAFAFNIISTLFVFFISEGIFYLLAKLLGGQGRAVEQLHLQALVLLGLSPILSILTIVVGAVPAILCIAGIVQLIVGLYMLFLTYKLTMVVHRVDSGKAIIIMVANIVFWVIVVIIIAVLFAALFAALLGGASPTPTP